MRTAAVSGALVLSSLALTACSIDVNNQGYIERDEKRFTVTGVAELHLTTFDGHIEVRGWDRDEVVVEIEKRGQDKDVVSRMTIVAEQKDNTVTIDARYSGSSTYIGIGTFTSPSARLIVSAPRRVNVVARSGDGNILADRIEGRLEFKTADGRVQLVETSGDVLVETGDGSIQLEDVAGRIEARTDDGTVRVTGQPSALRVRSGDGSIVLRVRRGTVMTDDWLVTTSDGSIVAELPEDFNAMIEAEPGSDSRARSDLELTNAEGGTRDQRALRGQLGAGGKRLTLRTGDGSVRLTNY
jgi:hypothetical protein